MPYSIEYYSPDVKVEIWSWPKGVLASFYRIVERMAAQGPNLGMPYTRAMGRGLFEIRAKGPEGIGRVFFCTCVGQRVVVLHGCVKKSDRTPSRELVIARARLKEVRHG
jgi:phage-related protein